MFGCFLQAETSVNWILEDKYLSGCFGNQMLPSFMRAILIANMMLCHVDIFYD